MDAKRNTIGRKQALALATQVDEIYAARGRRVTYVNLKQERPDAATLGKLLLGPTGNLRAPALRKGRTLVVGFDEATYRRLFG